MKVLYGLLGNRGCELAWDVKVKAEEDVRVVQFDGHSRNATTLEHAGSTVILLLSRIARLHCIDLLSIYGQSSDLESKELSAELLFSLQRAILLQPVFLLLKCEGVHTLEAACSARQCDQPRPMVSGLGPGVCDLLEANLLVCTL